MVVILPGNGVCFPKDGDVASCHLGKEQPVWEARLQGLPLAWCEGSVGVWKDPFRLARNVASSCPDNGVRQGREAFRVMLGSPPGQ